MATRSTIKRTVISLLLLTIGLLVGAYLGHRLGLVQSEQEQAYLSKIEEEKKQLMKNGKKIPTEATMAQEVKRIQSTRKVSKKYPLPPIKGVGASERNSFLKMLNETYHMLLNIEEIMLSSLSHGKKSIQEIQQQITFLLKMGSVFLISLAVLALSGALSLLIRAIRAT